MNEVALKAANPRLKMRRLDVKTAFLNSKLREEVYMRPPPEAGQPGVVWRLVKALYGLKQAARAWNETLTAKMQEDGYHASQHDPCLFMRGQGPTRAYVVVHVDDSIILADNGEDEKAIQDLQKHFDVKVMARVEFFLGQEMEMVPGVGILFRQAQYAWELLHKARMWECKPKTTPMEEKHRLQKTSRTIIPEGDDRRRQYMQWVGGLLCLTTHTRPDLAYSVKC